MNSSSDKPTQFRASASAPVTCPTFAVSFDASIRLFMGSASPKVPTTPAAMFDQLATSSSLVASCASSCADSVAVSLSPRTAYREL